MEIEREVKKFNKARTFNRFMILYVWYHVDYCKKAPVVIVNLLKILRIIFCLISTKRVLLKLYPIFKITVDRIIMS